MITAPPQAVASIAQQAHRLTIFIGSTHERRNGAWLGASILGSLGSHHEMWMSRAEYDEYGARRPASPALRTHSERKGPCYATARGQSSATASASRAHPPTHPPTARWRPTCPAARLTRGLLLDLP